MKVCVLFGKPGAGKDTVSKTLNERFGAHSFVTSVAIGQYLKKYPEKDESKRALEAMNAGHLCPTELATEIMVQTFFDLLKNPQVETCVISGSMRTPFEVRALLPIFKAHAQEFHTIVLNISDDILKERATKRLTCFNQDSGEFNKGHTFSLDTYLLNAPCPVSGCCGILARYPQDDPEKFEIRLGGFYKDTAPAIELLRELHMVHDIDANRSEEDVLSDVLRIMGKQ